MSTTINHTQIALSTDYKSWSGADIIQWIISINSSNFEKYRQPLTTAFQANNFSGLDITELDNADLKDYGIINLKDRNIIYKSMQQLIVAQKRRDSQTLDQPSPHTQDEDPEIIIAPTLMEEKEQDIDDIFGHEQEPVITEITMHYSYHEPSSDMDELELEELEEKEVIDHYRILLQRKQFLAQFHDQGFTEWIVDERYDQTVDLLAKGYTRRNHQQHSPLINDVYRVIIQFYAINTEAFGDYVEIQSGQRTYFTLMANISLSKILVSREKESAVNRVIIELKEIKTETLEHVLEYLGHHNGRQPAELQFTSGNAMGLNQTVQDQWEAQWIATFDDKTISKIVAAAEWLGLTHLKHLANNANIALLFGAFRFQL